MAVLNTLEGGTPHGRKPKSKTADKVNSRHPNDVADTTCSSNNTTPHSLYAILQILPRAIHRWLRSKRSNSSILFKKVTFREMLTGILLMIPSTATVMLTYYGVSVPLTELGGDIVQKGQALAFAITIGVFSWLGWFYLFGLIYRLRGKRLGASLAAAVFYVLSIAAIDAPFNMLALGGGSAVQMTLTDTTIFYEDQKSAIFARATMAQRLVPAIQAQAERFRKLEEGEIKHGTYSGSPGPGKVSSGFGQVASLLDTTLTELKSGIAASQQLQSRISAASSQLKRATFTQGPIRPRVEAVSNAADQMDDLLGRLSQLDYAVSIEATLTSLKAIFPAPTTASSAFEKNQNAQLGIIAEMAKPVAEALQSAATQLRAIDEPELKRVRPQDAMTAIRTKWKPLFPQWLAAVFIDIAPGALLIILITAFREVEARKGDEHDDDQVSST
ncbi:hypothetical protein [Stappia sp. ES.058]|uniref:hypothetical protein n=1 Tax=Stappia sp. ES.058 TaxID=1881061 RepID=UPI00087AE696|nr:hypothetical protein [Stappia sp. ES.058]SDU42521.1 hypothetical protein SAMN05428979_3701 [Stappia sp. ES.058]